MHFNFYKNYNIYALLYKNVLNYLVCFFIFVRIDVLNSIHSFNSFAISNNYKFLILLFIIFYFLNFFKNNKVFFIKYNKNKEKFYFILFFFKFCINIFLFYFFLNLFSIYFLNFQFLDFTKFIKIILLVLVFNYIYIFSFYSNSYFYVILLLFPYSLLDFFYFNFLIILFYFFKFYFFKKLKYTNLNSHLIFIIFIIFVMFNQNQIYFVSQQKNIFNYLLINNNYIILDFLQETILNLNSFLNLNLRNYLNKNNDFDFFFYRYVYINNIVLNSSVFIFYYVDQPLNYIFYNVSILLVLIILFIILILFKL